MRIEVLTAEGVRNLRPLTLAPRERFNVFVGDNGQGKTNLLEAIYAVATLRSFRTARLADLIAFSSASSDAAGVDRAESGAGQGVARTDAPAVEARATAGPAAAAGEARIGARVLKDELVRVYEVAIAPGGRRVTLDGKAARPLARYFGGFNVVVFTPEDLGLPRGSPGDRRRFLDRAVFNLRPEYLAQMQDYEKVIKQRNTVLKMAGQGVLHGPRVEELLAVYDAQLAPLALAIANARSEMVERVSSELAQAFADITRTGLGARARYVSKIAGASLDAVAQMIRDARTKDLATNATQTGPHRDDLAFELEERDAGAFASQGQLRAIMLAWKSAELAVLARAHGDRPILLLDDVSSELDPARNQYLFEHLASGAGQCFITTTDGRHVLLDRDRADYRIRNGEISS